MNYNQIMLSLGKGRRVDIEKKLNELKNNNNKKFKSTLDDYENFGDKQTGGTRKKAS